MTAKVVHCNGYSLAEDPRIPRDKLECISTEGTHRDWEYVCWGDPKLGALGRIPMTLWVARHVNADLIIWSTGSSRVADGDYEATVFLNRALQSFAALKRDFPHRFEKGWLPSEASHREWIQAISTTETISQRTADSLIEARRLIAGRFGAEPVALYSVSSANHAPRILRDELKAFEYGTGSRSPCQNMTLCAVAAETCYGRGTVQDVQVYDLGKHPGRVCSLLPGFITTWTVSKWWRP
jgi:hypothetical protein